MNNLDHIFGNITNQLKSLKADKMYNYKIVANYKGGKFKQVALAKTKVDAILKLEAMRLVYCSQGWQVIYYNIED